MTSCAKLGRFIQWNKRLSCHRSCDLTTGAATIAMTSKGQCDIVGRHRRRFVGRYFDVLVGRQATLYFWLMSVVGLPCRSTMSVGTMTIWYAFRFSITRLTCLNVQVSFLSYTLGALRTHDLYWDFELAGARVKENPYRTEQLTPRV